jgi:hypothetical protein
MLFTDLNIGIFLHHNCEEYWFFYDPKDGVDINLSGTGIKVIHRLDQARFIASGRGRPAFPSSCHLQPICNRLQPELSGMVKIQHFDSFTPIFSDFTGVNHVE